MFRTENLEDPEADADIQMEEEEAEFIKDDLIPNALSYHMNLMPIADDCASCEGDHDEDEGDIKHHHGGGVGGRKKGGKRKKREKSIKQEYDV